MATSSGSASPAKYRLHYLREIRLAATQLRVSQITVVLATFAVIAAVAMTWYGDEETKTGSVYVVAEGGTTTCGTVTLGKQGVLLVTPSGASKPTRIEPKQLVALVPTGTCP